MNYVVFSISLQHQEIQLRTDRIILAYIKSIFFPKITLNSFELVELSSIQKNSLILLNIFLVPPKRLSSLETVAYKGYTVHLRCPVDSYPAAQIRWMKPGTSFPKGVISVVKNALEIKHIQEKHKGVYLCQAKNMFGSTFTALSVKVRNEGE